MNSAAMIDRRYPIEVRAEARRIADRTDARYEDLPRIEAGVAHRFFMQAIEPIQAQKVRLIADFPRGAPVIIEADGSMHLADFSLDAGTLECIRLLDEMIAIEARRYGLDPK